MISSYFVTRQQNYYYHYCY